MSAEHRWWFCTGNACLQWFGLCGSSFTSSGLWSQAARLSDTGRYVWRSDPGYERISAGYDHDEYYQHNHFGDGCQYIVFTGAGSVSPNAQVQNYNFAQRLQGTSSAYLTVDGVRNRSYETKVAKNSAGELKIYCEADLVQ